MAANKLQWRRIAKGDKLPCQSFLRKKNGEILKLSTVGGVTVGQDAYYLPIDDVIEVIRNYPIEESEDEKIRRELVERFSHIKGFDWYGLPIKDILAWLEKQGEPKEINPSEFDSQLNRLLGQFKSLPKEELASSLSFYLNVVQNDGTYKKEKQGEQKFAEWSEQDKENLYHVDALIKDSSLEVRRQEYLSYWLKSLKDRVQPQPKQEWSEEDEKRISSILLPVEYCKEQYPDLREYQYDINWLKSLKERVLPNQWKPSEEQMKALLSTLPVVKGGGDKVQTILESLYQDLKKLRKE